MLVNGRRFAELKVKNMLAQLGILCSQLHGGMGAQGRQYDRLMVEIEEEVHAVEDDLGALEELNREGVEVGAPESVLAPG